MIDHGNAGSRKKFPSGGIQQIVSRSERQITADPPPHIQRWYDALGMTLCIGALAQIPSPHSRCIVLCFDSLRSAGDDFSSETEYKFATLNHQLIALYAGRTSRARELADIYRSHLSTTNLTLENVIEQLRVPVKTFKKRHAAAYIGRCWGFSYDEFMDNGEKWIGKERMDHHLAVIAANDIGVEMIFAGFIEGVPVLYELRKEEIREATHFAMIGTGAYTAEPAMHAREHTEHATLSEALYNTFEAKKIAETSPFVGAKTTMAVIHPPNEHSKDHIRAQIVTQDGFKHLGRLFKKYGPKPIKTWLDIPAGTLQTAFFRRDEGY